MIEANENCKVALITGGNKGLGLEIARQLAKKGVHVVFGSRDLVRGESAAKTLQNEGLSARAVKLNVTNADDSAALPEFLSREFGRLDILVSNAGAMNESHGEWQLSTVTTISEAELRATFDANFFGAVAVTRALLPLLLQSDAGRIVNQSSILASLLMHADPQSPIYQTKPFAYNASKTALNAFTIHLAYELRDMKIKVNAAHPGWVQTDMGTDAAPLRVQDGAKTAVELALLPHSGPSGGYFHLGESLPW